MLPIKYFRNKLDEDASLSIQRIYEELRLSQLAIDELVERTGWNLSPVVQFEGTLELVSKSRSNIYHNLHHLADDYLYQEKHFSYYCCTMERYDSDCRKIDTLNSSIDRRLHFYYFDTPVAGNSDMNVYRGREGQMVHLKSIPRLYLQHFGRIPYSVCYEGNGRHFIVKLTNLITDETYCYLMESEDWNLIRVRDQFLYIQQENQRTKIVHCASGRTVVDLDDIEKLRSPVCGNNFAFIYEEDDPSACWIIR